MAKREPAFPFILEELESSRLGAEVRIRPMFGCHAIYVGEKIIFILRHVSAERGLRDNGLWVVSTEENVTALRAEFPKLRRIELFQKRFNKAVPTWYNLPETDPEFEETAYALCALVIRRDPRVGKIPKTKSTSRRKRKPARKKRVARPK